MTRSKILLGSTSFDLDKQILFSKLSGDINPIHLDFIEARKSIAGECIVHGIHSFLWSIELLTNEIKYLFPNKTAIEESKRTISKIDIKTMPLFLWCIFNIWFNYP